MTCRLCDVPVQLSTTPAGQPLSPGSGADRVFILAHGPPGRPCPASGLRFEEQHRQPEPERAHWTGGGPRGGAVTPGGQGPMS